MRKEKKDNNIENKKIEAPIFSLVKTIHYGTKCEICNLTPIIGIRYKCHICKNYNICERCEFKNYKEKIHKHHFIKIWNQDKIEEKMNEEKKEKDKNELEISNPKIQKQNIIN